MHMELMKTLLNLCGTIKNSKKILNKKKIEGDIILRNFKIDYKATAIKITCYLV